MNYPIYAVPNMSVFTTHSYISTYISILPKHSVFQGLLYPMSVMYRFDFLNFGLSSEDFYGT